MISFFLLIFLKKNWICIFKFLTIYFKKNRIDSAFGLLQQLLDAQRHATVSQLSDAFVHHCDVFVERMLQERFDSSSTWQQLEEAFIDHVSLFRGEFHAIMQSHCENVRKALLDTTRSCEAHGAPQLDIDIDWCVIILRLFFACFLIVLLAFESFQIFMQIVFMQIVLGLFVLWFVNLVANKLALLGNLTRIVLISMNKSLPNEFLMMKENGELRFCWFKFIFYEYFKILFVQWYWFELWITFS